MTNRPHKSSGGPLAGCTDSPASHHRLRSVAGAVGGLPRHPRRRGGDRPAAGGGGHHGRGGRGAFSGMGEPGRGRGQCGETGHRVVEPPCLSPGIGRGRERHGTRRDPGDGTPMAPARSQAGRARCPLGSAQDERADQGRAVAAVEAVQVLSTDGFVWPPGPAGGRCRLRGSTGSATAKEKCAGSLAGASPSSARPA